MTDTDDLPDDVKDTVVEVNDLLESALAEANTYAAHDTGRPSAYRAFESVQKAHVELSDIDPTRSNIVDEPEMRPDAE